MREGWSRGTANAAFSSADLTALIQPVCPGQCVTAHEIVAGGLANTNVKISLSGQSAPLLVRFFIRDPAQMGKECALNKRLLEIVPVPRFLYAGTDTSLTGHPYVVMEWVEGMRLDVAIREADASESTELGRSVGSALAHIHSIVFPATGLLGPTLEVAQPFSMGASGLAAFLRERLIEGSGRERINADLARASITFVEREGGVLDSWDGPPCLTHSDFNGSNILVRRDEDGHWGVAAVLDWEFAFAGSPFADFGNLLRPPLGELPGFEGAVASGYLEGGGRLSPEWRRMSKLIDLTAWADFLSRPNPGPTLIRDSCTMIDRTIREWGDRDYGTVRKTGQA